MNAPVSLSEHRARRVRAGQPVPDSGYHPVEVRDCSPAPIDQPDEPKGTARWIPWYALFIVLVVAVVMAVRFTLKT